ncbi:MAG TPA: ribose-5-phosphate isomerase RpiA [Chloroflexota bacterium]|nr:ribose-5-phosphate isomerase RpiA [Chloroflexota bacterium]
MIESLKQQAGGKAVELAVRPGMVIGLGTGSTAVHATRKIGQLWQAGALPGIVGIPTSEATAQEAARFGIPLGTLDDYPVIDVTIDGADEIDPDFNLIKGLGGALLREKIVATASKRMVVVADDRKQVTLLGSRAPVPVEVVPFATRPCGDYLASLGARVVKRLGDGAQPVITDENNIILDCYFDGIPDPTGLAQAIRQQPGVVEHGLFLGLATDVILANPNGVMLSHRA